MLHGRHVVNYAGPNAITIYLRSTKTQKIGHAHYDTFGLSLQTNCNEFRAATPCSTYGVTLV